jgi:predicted CXXCH cytochrome family protein
MITLAAVLTLPSVALGNFAIHGNYVSDTDACAGCHRAHTSISTITWQDSAAGDNHSALLVTSATEMWQFCYACHDATSQGADTNVQQGIYEGTAYGTQDALLNGGGFDSLDQTATTSTHMYKGSSWGAYGGGYFGTGSSFASDSSNAGQGADAFMTGTGNAIKMDCATCHDPHGSPNYRILKTVVNGNTVGEYTPSVNPADPDPNGFVSSVEPGWPVNGFRLHTAYPAYTPNYTTPMYAKGYDMPAANITSGTAGLNATKGMSGWCAGCHSTYLGPVQTLTKTSGTGVTTSYQSVASTYNAGDGAGLALRHKHPINVELSTYNGPDKSSMIVTDTTLPLAHGINEQTAGPNNRDSDWIECLTCHRAHGTAASMTGYASNAGAASVVDTDGVARNTFVAGGAVPSALLRHDNRGVCERCHNK